MNKYYDLGTYSRTITTDSAEAQLWFDRGLNWCYGFNHEEAERCFHKAIELDPTCAMAWWGVAYARGPFINKTWPDFAEQERVEAISVCYRASRCAVELSHQCTLAERAIIHALTVRYPLDQAQKETDFDAWNDAYLRAMRTVYEEFPTDLDIITLFADAIHNKTPWWLWDIHNGTPRVEAHTVEAVAVIESGLKLIADQGLAMHPGLGHFYIHTLEMSPYPERALLAADALRSLVPDAGHLCHMPTHIYVLCGHYHQAIVASNEAITADKKYLEQVGPYDFYTTACCHDLHLKMYASMFIGQQKSAREAANDITNLLTEDVLRVDRPHMANTLEAYYSMCMHVYVRFGCWQEIIDAPLPSDPMLYCVTTAMFHYAKGVAYAALGQIAAAEAQHEQFEHALVHIPEARRTFNNRALDVIAIGREMLLGELAYRKGQYAEAFDHLRKAAYLDDHLAYTEPWAWMHPPRHALGALLLEQGHVNEAEEVYRADLGLDNTLIRAAQHPDNVWSLHGYVECLRRLNKDDQAMLFEPRLKLAMARADTGIAASCCCRLTPHGRG